MFLFTGNDLSCCSAEDALEVGQDAEWRHNFWRLLIISNGRITTQRMSTQIKKFTIPRKAYLHHHKFKLHRWKFRIEVQCCVETVISDSWRHVEKKYDKFRTRRRRRREIWLPEDIQTERCIMDLPEVVSAPRRRISNVATLSNGFSQFYSLPFRSDDIYCKLYQIFYLIRRFIVWK